MPENKQTILNRIKETVHRMDPGAQVILFGSQARGDSHAESDWDVLVLIDKHKDTIDFKKRLSDALYKV